MRALLLALLLPGQAAAQGVPPMSEATCRALVEEAGAALGLDLAPGAVAARDGWCEADLGSLAGRDGAERRVVGVADRSRWRGEGLEGLFDGSAAFVSLEVEIEGLRTEARTGDDLLDWLLAQQGADRGVDARLAARWDARAGELRIEELALDFPGPSAVEARATVARVDLSSRGAAAASLGSMAVTALSARVATDGLFEDWLLMPLGLAALAPRASPGIPVEATAAGLRADLVAAARALPPAIFPGGTPEALAALAAELPHPRGVLTVELDGGAAGLGPARLARFALAGPPRSLAEVWPILEGVTVEAAWAPLPPEDG